MKRDHVQKIFEILKRSPKGEMRREELLERVGLKQANLSRVLLIMEACGLIERAPQGRRMMIRLPDAEREQLRKAHRQVTTAKKGIWDRNIPIKEGDILIRQEGRYHEPGSYRPQSYWRFISEATAQRHGERVGQQHDLLIDPFIKPIKISRERRGFFESPSTDRKGALIRMEAASSLVTWAPKDGTRVFSKLKEGVHERSERDR
jgi:DNA-binding MarR family transcriptional regulator